MREETVLARDKKMNKYYKCKKQNNNKETVKKKKTNKVPLQNREKHPTTGCKWLQRRFHHKTLK